MMRLPPFTHLAPRTAADAARALAEHGSAAMPVAGGTDLYPNMKRRQFEPRVLVGLRSVREIAGVRGNAREGPSGARRSEEHTSELQSLRHLVWRLLPEKKKHHFDSRRFADAND